MFKLLDVQTGKSVSGVAAPQWLVVRTATGVLKRVLLVHAPARTAPQATPKKEDTVRVPLLDLPMRDP